MSQLHTAEEAHFLVRVGQWSTERLEQWVQARMDAEYGEDDMQYNQLDWEAPEDE